MRRLVLLVLALLAGLGWSYHRASPKAPEAAARVMAPDGTYYVLSYFATLTPNGLSGWTPGQQVTEDRRAAAKKGSVVITDGTKSAVVPRTVLTQDVEIAKTLRLADEATQEQTQLVSAAALAAEKARELAAAIAAAGRIEHLNSLQLASSTIGAFRSRLSLPAYAASGGTYRDERSDAEGSFPGADSCTDGSFTGKPADGSLFADNDLAAAVAGARREASRDRGDTIPSGLINRMATDAFHLDYLGSREQ